MKSYSSLRCWRNRTYRQPRPKTFRIVISFGYCAEPRQNRAGSNRRSTDSAAPRQSGATGPVYPREPRGTSRQHHTPDRRSCRRTVFFLDEEPLYYEYSFANKGDEIVAAPILYDRFRWNGAAGFIQSGEFRQISNETEGPWRSGASSSGIATILCLPPVATAVHGCHQVPIRLRLRLL